jgi:hypothetical protein
MAPRVLLATFLVLAACDHKLSKGEARELLPLAPLECDTKLEKAMVINGGVAFPASDKCGDALEAAGLLSKKRCGGEPPMCAANLMGPQARYGDGAFGSDVYLRYNCGSAVYTIDSVMTEGTHATVHYNISPDGPQPESLRGCATPLLSSHEGTFTASRDDDGHWSMDKRPSSR